MFKMRLNYLDGWNSVSIDENLQEIAEIDCETGMLLHACDVLEELGCLHFQVSGFGQDSWPVDISYDLATVLEQLPLAREQLLQKSGNFSINFFEQGIERELKFSWGGDLVTIECLSRTNWVPNPKNEFISLSEVRKMFNKLHDDFCETCRDVLPRLSKLSYYKEFCEQ